MCGLQFIQGRERVTAAAFPEEINLRSRRQGSEADLSALFKLVA